MIYTESSFYYMLQEIRKKPGIYLGGKSLKTLMVFWEGYLFGIGVKKFEQLTGDAFFEDFESAMRYLTETSDHYTQHFMHEFNQFVYSYYDVNPGSISAATLILNNSNSEEEAFDKFFELFDELSEKSEIIKALKGGIHKQF